MRELSKLLLSFFIVFAYSFHGQCQYPQGYFRNPLDIPIQLAANFGELRTNHFHMGLDIRTQSKENLPVYAAQEGYISRIKIEKYGYGRAIYINHPNGYTTLYAHLNDFFPELHRYVIQQQYLTKSWAQDIVLQPGQFTVGKGQFIAFSGNTGGSQGPHLHFEIRNTKTGVNINPELFGFDIPDKIAPVINALYVYDRRNSVYMGKPQTISIKKQGSYYTTQEPLVKCGTNLPGFAIRADDKNNVSPFRFGIYEADLFMDSVHIFGFKLNEFSYKDSRYINACMDYGAFTFQKTGIQFLFQLPENDLPVFKPSPAKGVVILNDTLIHQIRIEVTDVKGNKTTLRFAIKRDSVLTEKKSIPPDVKILLPDMASVQKGNGIEVSFTDRAFYDRVPFSFVNRAIKDSCLTSVSSQFLPSYIPLHEEYQVTLQSLLPVGSPLRSNVIMKLVTEKDNYYKKGIWNGNRLEAGFNRTGTVYLVLDTIAPTIKTPGWRDSSTFDGLKPLIISCTDNSEHIASFSLYAEDEWLLCSEKGNNFVYRFDEKLKPGFHLLTIKATDLAGNTTQKTITIKRLR
jgi:hypothetical protein